MAPVKTLALLAARLFLGFAFLVFGWTKVSGDPVFEGKTFSQFFPQFVQNSLQGHPFHFWRPVLQVFVEPHAGLFAAAVAWGEFLLGASLLLGALVSFSAVGGILLMASIQFCSSPFAGERPLSERVGGLLESGAVALVLLLLAVFGAGRPVGVDAWLFRPKEPPKPVV